MKTKLTRYLLAALLGVALTTNLHAQLVPDGGTLSFTGSTNLPGDLTVGTNGGNTLLTILAPGTVTNANGIIGLNATSTNNQVRVENSGAVWQNTGMLNVGDIGSGNQLIVTNGGVVAAAGAIGYDSPDNLAVVSGAGSLWTNTGNLTVGEFGGGNQLVVSNGGVVASVIGFVGYNGGANNNLVTVTGTNSQWRISDALILGDDAATNNQVAIHDGGLVLSSSGRIGSYSADANFQKVLVADPGSLWSNSKEIYVGDTGSGNQLVVSDGGTVTSSNVTVGFNATSTNNLLLVDDGNLIVSNLDVRRGTLQLDRGTITVGTLLATNATLDGGGFIVFNGGISPPTTPATLSVSNSIINNGSPLVVGHGSPAVYQLLGNGLHTFNDGLVISSGAALQGSGTIDGVVTVSAGGAIDFSTAGSPLQSLTLSNSPSLAGTINMRVKFSGAWTNDTITTPAVLNYGGGLSVAQLSLGHALAAGDHFKLFNAPSYGGAFTSLSLPSPGPGLMWTNQLLVNGSIAVVAQTSPAISGLVKSGMNLMFKVSGGSPGAAYDVLTSTNVALPLSSWTTNSTGIFDWMGNAAITNGIDPADPQRFFTISEH